MHLLAQSILIECKQAVAQKTIKNIEKHIKKIKGSNNNILNIKNKKNEKILTFL